MRELLPWILGLVGAVGGGTGLYSLLTVGVQKRQLAAQAGDTLANTVSKLGEAAASMVEPLQRSLILAESRADTLNAQLQGAKGEVTQLRTEAERAYEDLRRIRQAILEPTATIDGLRALVRRGPIGNPWP